jgi:spore coat protein U-like protein
MRGAAGHQRASLWATAGAFALLPCVAPGGMRSRPLAATLLCFAMLAGALAAGAALAFAADARADEIDGLRDLSLQVYGHLDQHCVLGSVDDADFGDLTHPGKHAESHVALDCNVPINVKISATNGALANDRHPQGQGPYAGSVPYSLEVRIPVRRPANDIMTRSFESKDLVGGGQTFDTGGGIAVDGMSLEVALAPPDSPAGLLAGRYSETIEITVTPS